jgi:hypothetical protein
VSRSAHCLVQVQTKPSTDPLKVMTQATNELALEIESIKAAFVVRNPNPGTLKFHPLGQ